MSADLMIGFQYSLAAGILPSNSTTVEASDVDGSYNYTTVITGLEPGTEYYYRSIIRQDGLYTYGETKTFSTKVLESMLETKEATDVEAASATLNAKLDLTDVQCEKLAYGFCWGSNEASVDTDVKGTEIIKNAYSFSLPGLSHKTQYWYKAYIILDGQTFYGAVKTFTTDVVKVESVSLDKSEYTFNTIGNTLTLNATVLPADATDKSVEWSSDNEEVATVDQQGKVKAIGNGKANITVTTMDQGRTATCAITVSKWVTSISLNKTSLTLIEGEEYTLTPTIKPDNAADKTLSWTSSDESIVKVDADGKVTAVSKGSATVKANATDGSGKFASCSVTVKRLVGSIALDKTSITIYNGQTETITATVTPSSASNTSVSWTSSNSSVATVSSTGVVTGKTRGTTTITVTANDGSGVSATCEVEVNQYVTSITLSKTSLSLLIGANETITVTSVLPDNANDKSYTWSSSDNVIATVDNTGKITANAKGTATIKATASDGGGFFTSCSVNVKSNSCPVGAVDLGLSVYWATSNLSETGLCAKPEGYGNFYAWGETETKKDYSWDTYKFGVDPFSKYNTDDYRTVLEAKDDVAHVKLGGKWRLPTDEEWTELRTQCTWTWTTQNGTNGRKVTGQNGNSIFLPAAGYRDDRDATHLVDLGSGGDYWSSSVYRGFPYDAWYVSFGSSNVIRSFRGRFFGHSVRPVADD